MRETFAFDYPFGDSLKAWILLLVLVLAVASCSSDQPQVFRAGASAVEVTPRRLPVIVNGLFEERSADSVTDPQYARALVLDDGVQRIALVVVDNLMIPRSLIDEAKELAQRSTGIPVERMLVSATHTHSAGSVMGCLGSDSDPVYERYLPEGIALAIEEATSRLQLARIGWAVTKYEEGTHCRRWILRPDKIRMDPFGLPTVRAMMHPGYENPDFLEPSGPVDAGLTVLAIQGADGPLAVLANYSMHYFGSTPLSADYFGLFAEKIKTLTGAGSDFVGIMSQGTSGDLQWMDYGKPRREIDLEQYSQAVAEAAFKAYQQIRYQEWVPLAMAERKLTLGLRLADPERLAWARRLVAERGDEKPRRLDRPGAEGLAEIYAREQVLLADGPPTRELKLQAIRIGELGITALPNEVFSITGLKLKAMSPLVPTMNIGLANGAEGYIPPPEQHRLGGYTTWPARTAGLEAQAEPQIVEGLLELLEEVSGQPRRGLQDMGVLPEQILAASPVAYWRMQEFSGSEAVDAAGRYPGAYENGLAFYLPGPTAGADGEPGSRAVHFAGGRMSATVPGLGFVYSLEMWFYNALPHDVRPLTGHLFWKGEPGSTFGDHLAIGGSGFGSGRLLFFREAGSRPHAGQTLLEPRTWNHLVLVRDGPSASVYLNGAAELTVHADPGAGTQILVAGCRDGSSNFEGRIAEVALYDRALGGEEILNRYQTVR